MEALKRRRSIVKASLSSSAVIAFLLLAHCGLILANERIVVDEPVLANGSLPGNQHSSANESGPTCGKFDRPEIPNRERNCPPPEDIPGCRCREGFALRERGGNRSSRAPTSLRVRCGKYADIQRAFGNFRTRRIRQLVLRNCLARLPSDLFRGLYVYELKLDKACAFQFLSAELDELPFQGLVNSLQKLKIDSRLKGGRSGELTGVRLSHLKRLGWLSIYNFVVPVIGTDFFRGGAPGCLHYLNIRWCGVERVADGAFTGLHSLERLHLSDNQLRAFNRASLQQLAFKLYDLTLNHNKLGELPEYAFSGMPSLRTVSLTYNSIRHLPEATWSPVWKQLQSLDLFENPLICDRDMDWIKRMKYPRFIRGKCSADIKMVIRNQTNSC